MSTSKPSLKKQYGMLRIIDALRTAQTIGHSRKIHSKVLEYIKNVVDLYIRISWYSHT